MTSSRPPRLGVRRRVQLSFAVGGLLVSAFLSTVTWSLTTSYLYDQRERTVVRQAAVSAEVLQRGLTAPEARPAELVDRAHSPGSQALLLLDGTWFTTSLALPPSALPQRLRTAAASGRSVQQRIEVNGDPRLVVGLPLVERTGAYFEVFPLEDLDDTLRTLAIVLASTSALATLLAAGTGRWATTRTLRPLREVSGAAARVARGDLATRIDGRGDPDLEPLAEAFNATTHELQARVERDARFASDVSHELRSPLTTVTNAVELLANRQAELTQPTREVLDLLRAEVSSFATLVEDLLEISRNDQVQHVALEDVRIADAVRRAADRAAGRPVTQVPMELEDVLVTGDRRRLDSVITNLVVNAEVHGGGVCAVHVAGRQGRVRIEVVDRGEGVEPDAHDRVFDRFFRGPRARASTSGSGLGLAIVASHVRLHGGTFTIEPGVPHGACFVIELPIAPAQA